MKFSAEQKRLLRLASKEQNAMHAAELFYQLLRVRGNVGGKGLFWRFTDERL